MADTAAPRCHDTVSQAPARNRTTAYGARE